MALNDNARFISKGGRALTAPVGEAVPDPDDLAAYIESGTAIGAFVDIGHTSVDGFINDGTDATTETLGSYQNRSLDVVETEAATEFISFDSLQVEKDILAMYYGGGTVPADGQFNVPQISGGTVEKALLLIRRSQHGRVNGILYPKVAITANGKITWPTDSYALVPLKFQILAVTGQPQQIWIDDVFVSTP